MDNSTRSKAPNEWVLVSETEYPKMIPSYLKAQKKMRIWGWAAPFLGIMIAFYLLSLGVMPAMTYLVSGGGGLLHVYLIAKANQTQFQAGIMLEVVKRNSLKDGT